MQNFRNLFVWQKAHQLTLDIYQVTRDFPSHEMFGLTSHKEG
ncbi:MAG: four helix bundle protein [Saprospiraceae bacterium]|nr:four helix bundle protein [Saprospiraceae bacterium]